MNAFHPNGDPIIGTLENIDGIAKIESGTFQPDNAGTLEFEYNGTTDINWSTQVTQNREGERLFITKSGYVCRESNVILKEE